MARWGSRSLAALAAGLVLTTALPAAARANNFYDSHSDGYAQVAADRSWVKVCDGRDDNLVYKIHWMNDNFADPRYWEVRAPQGGCRTDSSALGDVKMFRLYWGHLEPDRRVVWDGRNPAKYPAGR
ncbi:hypothetical protein HII36_09695 [Nonomuraea sp. NN258]|uniref:hypothetical protein n=1 Tax=Nonomuraea antri TaxID=2730852 RepID=UPI001569089C|nr:hypothetical protein [Nonomuraea antri]NRQ32109.1 hypothetical protein [Nonomuraea antri]